jgi:hypothetical protein
MPHFVKVIAISLAIFRSPGGGLFHFHGPASNPKLSRNGLNGTVGEGR